MVSSNFFTWILISKMGVMMNLRIISKNHEADPEIAFLKKPISKPYSRATAMPPAYDFNLNEKNIYKKAYKVVNFDLLRMLSSKCQIPTAWGLNNEYLVPSSLPFLSLV